MRTIPAAPKEGFQEREKIQRKSTLNWLIWKEYLALGSELSNFLSLMGLSKHSVVFNRLLGPLPNEPEITASFISLATSAEF